MVGRIRSCIRRRGQRRRSGTKHVHQWCFQHPLTFEPAAPTVQLNAKTHPRIQRHSHVLASRNHSPANNHHPRTLHTLVHVRRILLPQALSAMARERDPRHRRSRSLKRRRGDWPRERDREGHERLRQQRHGHSGAIEDGCECRTIAGCW